MINGLCSYLSIFFVLAGCRGEYREDLIATKHVPREEPLCADTGGNWHRSLLRCDCSGVKGLFALGRGCVQMDAAEFERQGLRVYSTDMTDEERMMALRGVPIPPSSSDESLIFARVRPWTVADIENAIDYATNRMYVNYDAMALRSVEPSAFLARERCESLVGSLDAFQVSLAGDLCTHLERTLQALDDDHPFFATALVSEVLSRSKGAQRLAVANLPEDLGFPIYRLVGSNEGFYSRSLVAAVSLMLPVAVLLTWRSWRRLASYCDAPPITNGIVTFCAPNNSTAVPSK